MSGKFHFVPVFVLLALVGCNVANGQEQATEVVIPVVGMTGNPDVETTVDDLSAPDCPNHIPGAHQLIDTSRGICFLYPDPFDIFDYNDGAGYTLLVPSLVGNHQSPVIWLTFEPADGRTLEEVTSQRLADYAFPDTQAQAIIMGNEPASLLDNLPGQDTNRRVVTIHDDRVVDLVIDHIGKNYGAAGEQAEAVYNMIASTFRFMDIKPGK